MYSQYRFIQPLVIQRTRLILPMIWPLIRYTPLIPILNTTLNSTNA